MPLVPLCIVHNIILNGTDKGKGSGCLFSPRRIEETGHNQRRREPADSFQELVEKAEDK